MRALALCFALAATPTLADTDAVRAADHAAENLIAAGEALDDARRARDRVAALTQTIQAYEDGLAAMRQGLRDASIRQRGIRAEFDRESAELTRLTGTLLSMRTAPEALLLLHPEGPVNNARAAMMLADVAPELEARVSMLKAQLEELELLRMLDRRSLQTLQDGLEGAQAARLALSQAITDRTDIPKREDIDASTVAALIQSAETLQGFASSLAEEPLTGSDTAEDFSSQKGSLPAPNGATVLVDFQKRDAAGLARPGWVLALPPRAMITNPWPATIRYVGPLLDFGNVVIVEPQSGYLIVFAGLNEAFGQVGEVVDAGAPLGFMGGTSPAPDQILLDVQDGSRQDRTETLYLELRIGQDPVDPGDWFAASEE